MNAPGIGKRSQIEHLLQPVSTASVKDHMRVKVCHFSYVAGGSIVIRISG